MTGDLNDSNNIFSGPVERTARDLGNPQDIVKEYRSMVRVITLSPFGFAKFCQYIHLVQGCDYCLPLVGEQFVNFILGDMLHIFPNDPSRNMRVSHLKRRRHPPVKSSFGAILFKIIWLVVWNMAFIFPSIGNFIIPTDELHRFSEG
jgi:hypothetical protein